MRRLTTLVPLFTLVTGTALAQLDLRAPPPNDNAASATSIVIPGVFTITGTMDESTIEAGEPAHQCTAGGPTTGAGSVWYQIKIPAGTLTVDTVQSEFNTAVTLYYRQDGPLNLPTLQAVGCADDGAGGSAQARLALHVSADEYLVQISRIGAITGDDLRAEFNFLTDIDPKGDSITSPIPLIIGKVAKSAHIESAQIEAFETPPSCDPAARVSSVWFRLVAPFTGTLLASAEGSLVASTTGVDDDVTLTVYRGSNFLVMSEIACSGDAAVTTPSFAATAGDTLWFRLTVNFPTNLFRPSSYKLGVRYTLAGLLTNGGFENDLTRWKLGNATNGDGITTVPGEVLAGTRSFKFVGSAGESTTLAQNVAISPSLRLRNTVLTPALFFRALSPPQSLSWTVTLVPSDGSAPVKLKFSRTLSDTSLGSTSIENFVTVERVSKIKLKFKNKNQTGSLTIDSVELRIRQFSLLRDARLLPPLPLPPPPQ